MSFPMNLSSQSMIKQQQMSLPYHPSLVRRKLDRKSLSKLVKHSRTADADTLQSMASTRPETIYDVVKGRDDSNLESLFDTSFIKAQMYACAIAIKELDVRQMCKNTGSSPCIKCSEILRQGCPIPEKLLHLCHGYTEQWLSERDISWWIERFSTTKFQTLKESGDAHAEPDLFRTVGAWSTDLKCDHARDVFLLSSRIDTVPGSGQGLIDVKSRSLALDEEDNIEELEETDQPQAAQKAFGTDAPEARMSKSHLLRASVRNDCGDMTIQSKEMYTPKDFVLVREQGKDIPTCISKPFRMKEGSDFGITSVPTSSFESDGNSHSHNSGLSSNDPNNTQSQLDTRKRKRLLKGSGHDGSEDDENLPAHRITNAMPLEDNTARLACHFYMFNRYKYCANSSNGKTYKTCPTGFKDSKDLRDHIKKKHCGPKHLCSRCHEEFNDAAQKGLQEVRDPRCEPARNQMYEAEKFILTGTNRRVQFDVMKKPKNISHEEHWFDTWNVIFPEHPFPTTPYMPHDAFDIAYSRITEEEINHFMHVQTQQVFDLTFDTGMRRSLRHLIDRIRERLREESQPERLFVFSSGGMFEDGFEQLAPTEVSSNGNTDEPIYALGQIANHQFIHSPPSIRVTDTTMPLHDGPSVPMWNGMVPQFPTATVNSLNNSVSPNYHETGNGGNGLVFYQGQYHDQTQDFPNFNMSLDSELDNRVYDHVQQGGWDFGHSQ